MTSEFRDEPRDFRAEDNASLAARRGGSARLVREPFFTPGDVAAFVVTLIMVCGPLAMGAFQLY